MILLLRECDFAWTMTIQQTVGGREMRGAYPWSAAQLPLPPLPGFSSRGWSSKKFFEVLRGDLKVFRNFPKKTSPDILARMKGNRCSATVGMDISSM
jgi:hypothetical protein